MKTSTRNLLILILCSFLYVTSCTKEEEVNPKDNTGQNDNSDKDANDDSTGDGDNSDSGDGEGDGSGDDGSDDSDNGSDAGDSDSTGDNAHTITEFSPASGEIGTEITITGTNFGTDEELIKVKIGEVEQGLISVADTEIKIEVVESSTTGLISVYKSEEVVSSSSDFTVVVIDEPEVASFNPSYGIPGSEITITGSNFSATAVENIVKFNGVEASIVTASETELVVTVPSGTSTGKISVSVASKTGLSNTDFEVLIDIPRDGLAAFFPFTGNATDLSGTITGNIGGPVLSTDRFGKANQAYSWDGANDYMDMGNPAALQISNTITISAWVNISQFKSPQDMSIITKLFFDPDNSYNPTLGYQIVQDHLGATPSWYVAAYNTVTLSVSELTEGTPQENSWKHLIFIIDGTNWKFYEDGVLLDSGSYGTNIMNDGTKGNLTIGSYAQTGNLFKGKIDDVAIYSKALSSAEISQLYQQTLSKY